MAPVMSVLRKKGGNIESGLKLNESINSVQIDEGR
ncbi:hypothetical protein A2U01_0103283, partial [Trifolium medium]|nr:hypothetical protein [Trifolium medium]